MHDKHPGLTVILTVYKRNNWDLQLTSLLAQSYAPTEIYVYQNESHLNFIVDPKIRAELDRRGIPLYHIHSKDYNFKFHGRFAIPLLLSTEYVAIYDDDTVSGERWLENCLKTSQKFNALVGANGRDVACPAGEIEFVKPPGGSGDGRPVLEPSFADLVGHCWFFRREWIHYMWRTPALTFENGEDIHLAAACKIYGGIPCVVPQMLPDEPETFGELMPSLGWDEHATYKTQTHTPLRRQVAEHWISKGWQPRQMGGESR